MASVKMLEVDLASSPVERLKRLVITQTKPFVTLQPLAKRISHAPTRFSSPVSARLRSRR